MTFPDNSLGLRSFEELIDWTVSYLHFRQALEVMTSARRSQRPT